MPVQKSVWYIRVLSFNIYFFTKLETSGRLQGLLHDPGKFLDKPMFNQVKVLDDVISFICTHEVWMFAPLFYLKQKNEKFYLLFYPSACNRSINHINYSPDGRDCLFLGGSFEVRVCKSRRWTFHKVRFPLSRNDRTCNRNRRNYWRTAPDLRVVHKDYSFLFYSTDDRRCPQHKD